MGNCAYTGVRDWTAVIKSVFLIILSAVMLAVYFSAMSICKANADWTLTTEENFSYSDCRFYFYDRTYGTDEHSIQRGHVYVIYYLITWASVLIISILSSFTLCLKCGTFIRRTFSALLFVGAICLAGGDVVSIMVTSEHYEHAGMSIAEKSNHFVSAGFTYLGMNIVVLLMQTSVLFNTIFDVADHSDQAKKEARRAEDTELLLKSRNAVKAEP